MSTSIADRVIVTLGPVTNLVIMADPLTIPDNIKPRDGRFGSGPSKVRPEQLKALSTTAAGLFGTSHRQAPVKDLVGRVRDGLTRALLGARRLRGRAGQRRVNGVLGRRGVRADRQAVAAPDLWRVQLPSSPPRSPSNPFVGDPIVVKADPGSAPEPQGDPSVDVIAWAHNETSTGVAVPVQRPDGSGDAPDRHRRHLRRRRPAGRHRRHRRLLLRAAEELRQRRRPVAGDFEPGGAGPDREHRRVRALGARLPVAADRGGQQPKNQTYNTPAIGTLVLLAEQIEWLLGNGGLEWAVKRTADSSQRLYSWAEDRPTRRRSSPTRAALPGRRHDRLQRRRRCRGGGQGAAGQRHRRHRALPQTRPQPVAGRDVPRRRPRRRQRADPCVDWVVERL